MGQPDGNSEQSSRVLAKTTNAQGVAEEKTFVPLESSSKGGSGSESEAKWTSEKTEQKLQELLKVISSESLQLNAFLSEENRLVNEVCLSLTQVMKKLQISFDIPAFNISSKRKIRKAILNDEGSLKLFYEKDGEKSDFLANYPPETVLAVLWAIMPELAGAMTSHRKRLSARISFIERVKKELKNVAKAVMETSSSTEQKKESLPTDSSKNANQS
jgi:hypothetical protein